MRTKKCSGCKQKKKLSNFTINNERKDKLNIYCKDCKKEKHLKNNYGLTLNQHKEMYVLQNGCCKICNKPINYGDIHVDHNHKTGKVRGLICFSCNLCLGWYENHKEIIKKYLGELK